MGSRNNLSTTFCNFINPFNSTDQKIGFAKSRGGSLPAISSGSTLFATSFYFVTTLFVILFLIICLCISPFWKNRLIQIQSPRSPLQKLRTERVKKNGFILRGGNFVKADFVPFWKGAYSKRKDLLVLGANSFFLGLTPFGRNFFPFSEDPFSEKGSKFFPFTVALDSVLCSNFA